MNKEEEELEEEKKEKRKELEKRYSWIKGGLLITIPAVLAIIVYSIIAALNLPQWLSISGGVLSVIVWFALSIKIVGPAEMGVLVILGVPVTFVDSGIRLIPFFFACYIVLYPRKLYNLNYIARKIISKEAEYPSPEEEPDPKERRKYGAQVLAVDSVAYIRFPQDDDLIEILKSRIPTREKDLLNWTEESVVGSIRATLGGLTWKEATENIRGIRKKADELFRGPDSPLRMAGFNKEDLKLAIEEILPPEELTEALPTVDIERLQAEAALFEAEQRAEETGGALIQMFCRETGMARRDVEKALRDNPGEFIKKYKEIWEKNWDIVIQRMAIEGDSYLRTDTQNPIQDLLALFKRMPLGKQKEE